jgi:hypothetical protein
MSLLAGAARGRTLWPLPDAGAWADTSSYLSFFLWRFFLSRFLRLWVAILRRFLFLPLGMRFTSFSHPGYS